MLDTSVLIDLNRIAATELPVEVAVSTVSLAELVCGPLATEELQERARRQGVLERIEALVDPLPFDVASARAYAHVYASVRAAGRKPRGARAVDLLIAATALSRGLPLYTCNPDDFAGLDGLDVIPVAARPRS
ncbi:MAG: type II toxin-antitoxin system VapC family toxin [Solirubrobacterales bacterium]|nr:type II toxin-antitoxin system VapC family toxin [Solirubrobacterales bacterium]